jgi:hypothetical protein
VSTTSRSSYFLFEDLVQVGVEEEFPEAVVAVVLVLEISRVAARESSVRMVAFMRGTFTDCRWVKRFVTVSR